MKETPKYHLPDVRGHLRDRVLDLCIHRLWHDALELLQQNGFNHYDHGDLMNFYGWAPARLPDEVAADPPTDNGLSSERGVHAASSPSDRGCGEAQPQQPQLPATAQNSDAIAPASTSDRSADSLSAFVPVTPASTSSPDPQLHEARQRLVQLLAARSADAHISVQPPSATDHESLVTGSLITDLRPPTSGLALLSDLRDLINRYVVLPEMAAETLALWVVHTYAFTLRQVTTYIGVVSPEKRCGKTTLLELLGFLAYEAVAAANISPPALFRVIQETQPTLIIDEADTFMQARDEMAGILNAGYRKGNSYVVRASEGRGSKKGLVKYSCWCPKVMAAIGRLPDTLADRCIVVTMQRKMPGEKCERLRELDATPYRQRCADFVHDHSDAIARARPDIPSALNDRAADIWEPLLAIADLAGGDWPALARRAAEELSASYNDDITLIGYLLKDLRNLMVLNSLQRVLSRELVTALNRMEGRPWEDLRRGREINEWWLAHKMSELGIRSRMIRVGDATGKGYMLADVDAPFRRYVPNAEAHSAQPPPAKS